LFQVPTVHDAYYDKRQGLLLGLFKDSRIGIERESNEKQLEIGNGCGTDGRTIWLQSVQTNNGTNRMYNDDDDVVAAQSYN